MTVTGSRGSPEDEVPVRLTPRQRQVIGLIERGDTNAQVAEELGVSLDGAKWHVREIMSTLGVDTREDAAEYWRRRNGLPSRLQRLRQALIPQGSWLRVATVATAAAVLAAGVIAAAIFLLGDDGTVEPAATTTAEPLQTVTATPTPETATATPTADPNLGPDGVVIEDFEIGPPVDILAGGVLYWSWAGIEGPHQNLYRGYRTASGETVIEDLYANLQPREHIAATVFDIHTGQVAVLLCRVGYCGGYGEPELTSEADLLLSDDFGATWSEPARVPVGWFPVIFMEEGLVARQHAGDGRLADFAWELHPSGEPFAVPDGAYPFKLGDGRLVYSVLSPEGQAILDLDGTELYRPPPVPDGAPITYPVRAVPSLAWTQWNTGAPSDLVGKRENGRFTRVLRMEGGGLYFYTHLHGESALGRWDTYDSRERLRPVVIDLEAGVVSQISDLGETQGYFAPYGLVEGAFAEAIPGAGDCLNVRAAPSLQASVIECVSDGVLLPLTGATETADGTEWRGVTLASGDTGWASAQFLR